MGVKIVGSAFTASIILLVKHGVKQVFWAASLAWPSHLQADLAATCWRDTDLLIVEREEGNNHDRQEVHVVA